MPRIFDYNLQVQDRVATVASIRALKGSGRKMVEVTAESAADAIAVEAAGIEMVVADSGSVAEVRSGSSRLFLTAAIDFSVDQPLTEDEVLRASIEAMKNGADAIHTCRRPQTIKRLTDEGIPVMCHVGFVPRISGQLGGIRGVGKTAEEASKIWDEICRLEDAGAFAVECELVAAKIMKEITKRTSMATISLGSGMHADIIGQFTSDTCGDGDFIPRHARAYANLHAMRQKIEEEKVRALTAFRQDVHAGEFPNDKEIINSSDEERDSFVKMLSGLGPIDGK